MSASDQAPVDRPAFAIALDHEAREIRVSGELDLATVPRLVESAMALQARAGALTIDLQLVTFLDASALGALVGIAVHQRGVAADLHLLSNDRVRRLAELGGLEWLLTD